MSIQSIFFCIFKVLTFLTWPPKRATETLYRMKCTGISFDTGQKL